MNKKIETAPSADLHDAIIAPPVAAGSVDTPTFRRLQLAAHVALSQFESAEACTAAHQAFVGHIDAHTAQLVADALAGQMAVFKKAVGSDQAEFNRKWTEQKDRAEFAQKQWDNWMASANDWKQRAEKADAELDAALAEIEVRKTSITFWRDRKEKAEVNLQQVNVWRAAALAENIQACDRWAAKVATLEAALAQVAGQVPVAWRWKAERGAVTPQWQYGDEAIWYADRSGYIKQALFATPQPAPVAGPVDDLPALPDPHGVIEVYDADKSVDGYTADQMRGYAIDYASKLGRAALATPPAISTSKGAPAEPGDGIASPEFDDLTNAIFNGAIWPARGQLVEHIDSWGMRRWTAGRQSLDNLISTMKKSANIKDCMMANNESLIANMENLLLPFADEELRATILDAQRRRASDSSGSPPAGAAASFTIAEVPNSLTNGDADPVSAATAFKIAKTFSPGDFIFDGESTDTYDAVAELESELMGLYDAGFDAGVRRGAVGMAPADLFDQQEHVAIVQCLIGGGDLEKTFFNGEPLSSIRARHALAEPQTGGA